MNDALSTVWQQWGWPAGVAAATLLAVLALRYIVVPVFRRLGRRTTVSWDDALVQAVAGPVTVWVAVQGTQLALLQVAALSDAQRSLVSRVAAALTTATVLWAVMNLLSRFADRYEATARERGQGSARYVGLLRKLLGVALITVAGVTIISQLGYKVTPLLTGLGIGGLAVALALEDTLSNFFAGIYMMVDEPMKVGDYVKLATGEEGFIHEIGWRNTRIRPWSNNLIIIPNAKLSQTVVTNNYLPVQEMSVYLEVGVGYGSDLETVETVTVEVATAVQKEVDGAKADWEPLVYYHTFGDSNIEFSVVLRVVSFEAQWALKHRFIKELHRRYAREGIEISFPVRRVEFSEPSRAPMRSEAAQ